MSDTAEPFDGSATGRRFSYHVHSHTRPGLGNRLQRKLNLAPPPLEPDFTRILVACMPKSGSTFLATALTCLPGMRRANLTPMPVRRREQELDLLRLLQEEELTRQLRSPDPVGLIDALLRKALGKNRLQRVTGPVRGWVAQHHVRCTEPTETIIEDYKVTPVVLVRNLFDALISLRDHLKNDSIYMTMAYYTREMRNWSDEQMLDFLVDMVAPWYIHFYVSWQYHPKRLQLSYERLRADPTGCMTDILRFAGHSATSEEIEAAVATAKQQPIRLNKGVTGRGAAFSEDHRQRVARLAGYYPDIDFSPIGLQPVASRPAGGSTPTESLLATPLRRISGRT